MSDKQNERAERRAQALRTAYAHVRNYDMRVFEHVVALASTFPLGEDTIEARAALEGAVVALVSKVLSDLEAP